MLHIHNLSYISFHRRTPTVTMMLFSEQIKLMLYSGRKNDPNNLGLAAQLINPNL